MAGVKGVCRDAVHHVSTEGETKMQDMPAGHLSGKPDGAAAREEMTVCGCRDAVHHVSTAWESRLLPRRGAQIKKIMPITINPLTN